MTGIVGVVDPALIEPPTVSGISSGEWVVRARAWTDLIADTALVVTMPGQARDLVTEDWWRHQDAIKCQLLSEGSPLRHNDLVVIADQLQARTASDVFEGGDLVELDDVAVSPRYVSVSSRDDDRDEMEHHLGLAAVRRGDDGCDVAVITVEEAWASNPVTEILIEANVSARATTDIPSGGRGVREYLRACLNVEDVYGLIAKHPTSLISCPRIAVEAFHLLRGGDRERLGFSIAPGFSKTLIGMGYERMPARARTCWRTMAFIACGQEASLRSLNAHPHRLGRGSASGAWTDSQGRRLMRGYLANRSPNAHRLFWWDGQDPEFVGVAGHDDAPPL